MWGARCSRERGGACEYMRYFPRPLFLGLFPYGLEGRVCKLVHPCMLERLRVPAHVYILPHHTDTPSQNPQIALKLPIHRGNNRVLRRCNRQNYKQKGVQAKRTPRLTAAQVSTKSYKMVPRSPSHKAVAVTGRRGCPSWCVGAWRAMRTQTRRRVHVRRCRALRTRPVLASR